MQSLTYNKVCATIYTASPLNTLIMATRLPRVSDEDNKMAKIIAESIGISFFLSFILTSVIVNTPSVEATMGAFSPLIYFALLFVGNSIGFTLAFWLVDKIDRAKKKTKKD